MMLTSKQKTLKPLLESMSGVHLTAYLVNGGELTDLRAQLRSTIDQATDWLTQAMSIEERKKFLEPLEALLIDSRIFNEMKGNIGIFRNQDSFRVLNVPIPVEPSCQVATSFHVKPLLRWLQGDHEFLLLGLENDAAHLYLGSQDTFKNVVSILFPDHLNSKGPFRSNKRSKREGQKKTRESEAFDWLNKWILEMTKSSRLPLFLAGEPSLVKRLQQGLSYKNMSKAPAFDSFSKESAVNFCQMIRSQLKHESKQALEKALVEFRIAEEGNRARKNIFQISKAVVQGKVKKLIVTDELSIFGKIDLKSGGIAIHPFDLDHEDDCILDDLAQIVLSKGGEVIVAKRDEIPKGRPILAILEDDESVEHADDFKSKAYEQKLA